MLSKSVESKAETDVIHILPVERSPIFKALIFGCPLALDLEAANCGGAGIAGTNRIGASADVDIDADAGA